MEGLYRINQPTHNVEFCMAKQMSNFVLDIIARSSPTTVLFFLSVYNIGSEPVTERQGSCTCTKSDADYTNLCDTVNACAIDNYTI